MKMRFWVLQCFLTVSFLNGMAQDPVEKEINPEDILSMSLDDLMNIQVVSASKKTQSIGDVEATIRVITAEQIRDRGYFTLEEALSDLPGFQFRNIQGFNSYLFMRGATSQNNLILLLVDGVQINELNSGGFYAGGQFNLSDLKQIEVVYGPASALYGTNAVSGIINLITRNPGDPGKGQVSLLGGSYQTGSADFNLHGRSSPDGLGYSVSGMYKTSEKADLRGARSDNNWSDEMENFENDWSVSTKLVYRDFQAGVLYQSKQSSNTTYHSSFQTPYADRGTLWNIGFANAYLKYSNQHHKRWSLNSMLYYRNSTVMPNTIFEIYRATDTTSGDQIGYYRPNHLVGTEHQWNVRPLDFIDLSFGLVGELESLSSGFSISHSNDAEVAPPQPTDPPRIANELLSYYVRAGVELPGAWTVLGGWRHDFSSYYGKVLTPRVGLMYHPDRWSARLLYHTAYRAPRPWDYTSGIGNTDLKPERANMLEGALSWRLSRSLNLSASVYKNVLKDKLMKEFVSDSYRWVNQDEMNTLGAEFSGQWSFNKWFVDFNYTYAHSEDQNGMPIPEIAAHTANAVFNWSFLNHFRALLRVQYLGERSNPTVIPATGTLRIDDALLFHAGLSYLDWKGFDFQIRVNNLTDLEYYHPTNLYAGRCRQPQRTIQLKVTRNF